jgi:hypothetical protein
MGFTSDGLREEILKNDCFLKVNFKSFASIQEFLLAIDEISPHIKTCSFFQYSSRIILNSLGLDHLDLGAYLGYRAAS